MDKLLTWFFSLVFFLIHFIILSISLTWRISLGIETVLQREKAHRNASAKGKRKKWQPIPQGCSKHLWSIFSLITPTSYQSPKSCYLKCQCKLFLGFEGTMHSKNKCVKSKYDCHINKQGMRENMSSKIDQLIQRTPTRQVDESHTQCRQSSCWMENTT